MMEYADLARLASGHVEARIIQAAVQLEIFDTIGRSPSDTAGIAASLVLDPRAAELILNALTALKLLEKKENIFSLTPVAATYLVKKSPQYLGGMILFDASLWSCWEKLADAVRSGKPVRLPNMYQDDAQETETFIGAMDSLVRARGDAEILATVLDWTRITDFLDVGSGPATYPIYLCKKFDHLRATVFDLPGTANLTRRYIQEARMEPRVQLVTGNYRVDPIPGEYDAVLLSNIIHGEGPAENQRLISRLYANLRPGGKLIIKDHILDLTRTYPPVGAIFSLLMLLTTEAGRCYSFDEVKSWFDIASLKNTAQINLPAPLTSSLVVGQK
jgi:SAM-dependent methyltransferase